MTTELQELHEGDRVRIIDGDYRGKYGKIWAIGERKGFRRTTPICLVYVFDLVGPRLYLRDEIERVEESRGVV